MALGLLGGEGISRLQLSRLSTEWTISTWASFFFFYFIFYLTSGLSENILRKRIHKKKETPSAFTLGLAKRFSITFLYRIIILSIIVLSWSAFIFEAIKLGFVPLFTVDTPHAYSYFHLKGIHYFTTLAILVPGISMLYLEYRKTNGLRPDIISILGIIMPLVISVLLVSRFQFMFAAILALFVAGLSGRKYNLWQICLIFLLLVSVYVIITIERAHSVEYLNGIFEMKDPKTPIFITQPYMYIANNFDNFNVMTEKLTVHSGGLRMLYPFLTLTGLKFMNPDFGMAFPLFTTKEELTTVTLLYDAWYDFGLPGIIIFGVILGVVTGFILFEHKNNSNPFTRLIYAELAFYFSVSFFTTWFSNPATWFYLGFSVLFYQLY
ncbi:O-antigen polymerase [Oribacterium sp. WCC10]|uniref:O-antigen polymerase n=1 Tax=Oribacterium sp. WCC10 TaxID=1855343 RepID=UPI001587737A